MHSQIFTDYIYVQVCESKHKFTYITEKTHSVNQGVSPRWNIDLTPFYLAPPSPPKKILNLSSPLPF